MRRSTRSSPGSPRRGARVGSIDPTWSGVTPTPTSPPFSRGAGPGTRPFCARTMSAVPDTPRTASTEREWDVGAAARPARRGGGRGRCVGHRAQARLDAGPGPPRRRTSWASSTPSATSAWSRCARRRAVPNLSECWADGTATFMVCGERCTRACGFCLVDTRHPEALDVDRARPRRRGGGADGPRVRRRHHGGPRRPARRGSGTRRRDHPGDPRASTPLRRSRCSSPTARATTRRCGSSSTPAPTC